MDKCADPPMRFETTIGSTTREISKCKQSTKELEKKECDAPESKRVRIGKSKIEIKPSTETFLPQFGPLLEGVISKACTCTIGAPALCPVLCGQALLR